MSRRWQVGLAVALASGSVTCAAASAAPRQPVHPEVGIGVVRIGDAVLTIERRLGRGDSVAPRFRRYGQGAASLVVGFDRGYHVDSVQSSSDAATLFGHPLSRGYGRFADSLRRHGWHSFGCQSTRVSTHHHDGRATRILWDHNQVADVLIERGGPSSGCALGSPANPADLRPRKAS